MLTRNFPLACVQSAGIEQQAGNVADKYRNFAALVAPHGGGIEPGTSELADAIAASDLSFYTFEGLKPSGNTDLHITSTRFDEPMCLTLLASSTSERKSPTSYAVRASTCGSTAAAIYRDCSSRSRKPAVDIRRRGSACSSPRFGGRSTRCSELLADCACDHSASAGDS
jgi:poly-gamma-glutamate hydrolase-like protein